MKNINKSFALLCMGFAAVACVEENFEDNTPKYDTTPGNEIVFSATAGIENGMPEPETKTVYGDPGTDESGKKWIEINWENGDMVQIVSPEAAGPEVGHYRVVGANQNSGFNQTHQSASLTKLGDAALQWSESDDYTFYGVYPSFAYDSDNNHGATASLTKDGLFTGSMPIDQNYTLNDNGSAANGWIAAPDMKYAFMTASDTYKRAPAEGETDNRTPAEKAINLEFKSMVTALQFDIMPGEINYNDPVTNHTVSELEVISVSLLSGKVDPEQTGKSISGSFNYNIPSGEYSPTQGTRMVSLHFDNKSVKLSSLSGKSLNVTFFILPENFDSTDKLQLQIIFKLGATQVSRIATINTSNQERPIVGGKKYIFNNVQLPALKTNVVSSSWWDTLDPDTILPQISIPVAANVFANSNPEYLGSDISPSLTQQTLTLEQLWAMGVRGFEIQTRSATKVGDSPAVALAKSIGDEPVIAAGMALDMTFGDAFNELAGLLMKSKDSSGHPTECLFIICTYSALSDGYNPYVFVSNLFNYLTAYCASNNNGITTENFEQISDATTVGDLRGKIAIIIRPGDDERWLYETSEYNNQTGSRYTPRTDPFIQLGVSSASEGLTGLIPSKLNSDWWGRVMLISDWGAESYDVWDRRYGSNYARQAVFNELLPSGRGEEKSYFEDYLWAATLENATLGSTSYNSTSSDRDFPTNTSIPTSSGFNYEHKMSNNAKAFVQEWMRVIPDGGLGPIAILKDSDGIFIQRDYRTIWAKWPGSYTEKTNAIENLFEEVVKTRGQAFSNLYINVLSGYYADWSTSNAGLVPQKSSFTTSNGSVAPSGPGKGGNFSALARDLNKYTYDLLSAQVGAGNNRLGNVGPWGLVMMDHINLVQDQTGFSSADLVELIMMNNFKFDMTTTPSGGQGGEGGGSTGTTSVKDYNSVYLDGENAINFE